MGALPVRFEYLNHLCFAKILPIHAIYESEGKYFKADSQPKLHMSCGANSQHASSFELQSLIKFSVSFEILCSVRHVYKP